MSMNKTPEEVLKAIAVDFKKRSITHEKAGEMTGKSRSSISNLFTSKKYLSSQFAKLFSDAFGYNINFLLYGSGSLYPEKDSDTLVMINSGKWAPDNLALVSIIDVASEIINLTQDKDANLAWLSFENSNYEAFKMYIKRLSERTGASFSLPENYVKLVCSVARGQLSEAPLIVSKQELSGETE